MNVRIFVQILISWIPIGMPFISLAQSFPIKFDCPKSPNVASFEKYLNSSVNLNAGTISYGLPLYTIEDGDLQIPITLSYNSRGLSMDEVPSWTGLGWDLNAGGFITRMVNGLPDDISIGMLNNGVRDRQRSAFNNTMNGTQKYLYFKEVVEGDVDAQFDVYSFSMLGKQGKFYIRGNECITLPKSNLKISYTLNPAGEINSFSVIDESGTAYTFGLRELSVVDDGDAALYAQHYYNAQTGATWHLTKVTSKSGREINFEYNQYNLSYNVYRESETLNDRPGELQQCRTPQLGTAHKKSFLKVTVPAYQLRKITWGIGRIDFIPGNIRQDLKALNSNVSVPALGSISVVETLQNIEKKRIDFETSQSSRLLLKGVHFVSPGGGARIDQSFYFNYNEETNIPSLSKIDPSYNSQDYWGFYNGVSQNTLLPYSLLDGLLPIGTYSSTYQSANRAAIENASKIGMLNEIRLPTGGKITYEYESNKVLYGSYNEMPHLLKSLITPAYSTIFYGSATTNGSTITESDGSGSFTVANNNTPLKISSFEYINDQSGFSYSVANIFPNSSVVMPNECPVSATYTSNPYSATLQKNCIRVYPAGTYQVQVHSSSYDNHQGSAWLRVEQAVTPNGPFVVNVGGIRVKKIISYSKGGEVAELKEFIYPLSANSGENAILKHIPTFYSKVERNIPTQTGSPYCQQCNYPELYTLSDRSVHSLPGDIVEYPKVIELIGSEGAGGKTTHSFTASATIGGFMLPPYADPAHISWKGGQENLTEHFSRDNGLPSFTKVKESKAFHEGETINNMNVFDMNLSVSAKNITYCANGTWYPALGFPATDAQGIDALNTSFAFEYVPMYNEAFIPIAKEEITFDLSHITNIVKRNEFVYGGSSKVTPSQIKAWTMEGKEVTTNFKYAIDYSIPGGTLTDTRTKAIKNEQLLNVWDHPIETYKVIKETNGEQFVVEGTIILADPDRSMMKSIYKLDVAQKIPLANFVSSNLNGTAQFVMDSRYRLQFEVKAYDERGNAVEFTDFERGLANARIFDYGLTHPIAVVENAKVKDIAYTSFEGDGSGNWIISTTQSRIQTEYFTGRVSFEIGGNTITSQPLENGGKYIVSYWTKSLAKTIAGAAGTVAPIRTVNGWTNYVHKITGTGTVISISGTGIIDELRLFPAGSLMKSYTYDPLVGITSESDPNNLSTYYEYDEFNKLKNIKDFQSNIIRNYQYNFTNSCGNTCIVLPMQTFTGFATPGYPVGVFDVNKNYIGLAGSSSEYVSLWNADVDNQVIGQLSLGSDGLRFKLSINSGVAAPPAVFGLRYYRWDIFSGTTVGVGTDNLSFIDWGDGHRELLNQQREGIKEDNPFGYALAFIPNSFIHYRVTKSHTYSFSQARTITVFHNETTEYVGIASNGINDEIQDANIRGNYPLHLKAIYYDGISNSSDLNVTNFSQLTEVVFAGYFFGSSITTKHNNWQSLNQCHKLKWIKMNYKNGGEILSNLRSNFPQLRYFEAHEWKPDISTSWGVAGFPEMYLVSIGLEGGYTYTAQEVDIIINAQASVSNLSNGLIGFGPRLLRSTASNSSTTILSNRNWLVDAKLP